MYKIRNKETGLYSSGGGMPHWTKIGKAWNKLYHVRAHLRSNRRYKDTFYANAEIMEFEISTGPVAIHKIDEVL